MQRREYFSRHRKSQSARREGLSSCAFPYLALWLLLLPVCGQPPSVANLRQAAAEAQAKGEREQALAFLLRAREAAPNDTDMLFEFGMTALGLMLNEDADEAEAWFTRVRTQVQCWEWGWYTFSANNTTARVGNWNKLSNWLPH